MKVEGSFGATSAARSCSCAESACVMKIADRLGLLVGGHVVRQNEPRVCPVGSVCLEFGGEHGVSHRKGGLRVLGDGSGIERSRWPGRRLQGSLASPSWSGFVRAVLKLHL
jgi:hypothetical protein